MYIKVIKYLTHIKWEQTVQTQTKQCYVIHFLMQMYGFLTVSMVIIC